MQEWIKGGNEGNRPSRWKNVIRKRFKNGNIFRVSNMSARIFKESQEILNTYERVLKLANRASRLMSFTEIYKSAFKGLNIFERVFSES